MDNISSYCSFNRLYAETYTAPLCQLKVSDLSQETSFAKKGNLAGVNSGNLEALDTASCVCFTLQALLFDSPSANSASVAISVLFQPANK